MSSSVCDIYLALSRRRERRITAVKTVTKDFAEQNRTPLEPLKIKRGLLFEREEQRERTRKRLNDDLIGFVLRERQRTKTNNCGERIFFEFFSFFSPKNVLHYFFEHERTVEKPTERERERERERNDDADFVNDFKHDDSDDEKNERGWSSKSSFLFLHAEESKRDDGFLLLLLEIVFEKKDDDDFLIVIVQKCRRDDGSAKAVQKNVFKVVRDDLVVFLFGKKKKRERCNCRLFLFV